MIHFVSSTLIIQKRKSSINTAIKKKVHGPIWSTMRTDCYSGNSAATRQPKWASSLMLRGLTSGKLYLDLSSRQSAWLDCD
jgi:hypothetical protein